MKKYLWLACASLALAAPAQAADLEPIDFDWSGAYIGVSGGYAFGHNDTFLGADFEGDPVDVVERQSGAPVHLDPAGIIGGAFIGYNFNADPFIIGIEADASLLGANDAQAQDEDLYAPNINGLKTDITGIETLRARIGVANGRALFYGTGGLALGQITNTYTYDNTEEGFSDRLGHEFNGVGFAVGAGMEYAFTDNMTFRAEYLYVDLGDDEFSLDGVYGEESGPAEISIENTVNIVRAGVSLKF
jgi:outer membrane immunogenic protein